MVSQIFLYYLFLLYIILMGEIVVYFLLPPAEFEIMNKFICHDYIYTNKCKLNKTLEIIYKEKDTM